MLTHGDDSHPHWNASGRAANAPAIRRGVARVSAATTIVISRARLEYDVITEAPVEFIAAPEPFWNSDNPVA